MKVLRRVFWWTFGALVAVAAFQVALMVFALVMIAVTWIRGY